jgi:hypothetical protein
VNLLSQQITDGAVNLLNRSFPDRQRYSPLTNHALQVHRGPAHLLTPHLAGVSPSIVHSTV